jgi:hemoglobin
MTQTLYERYGGFATVSRLVMAFYDNILDSDKLADYFEEVDMRRLIDHQTKFISSLMGGPASYSNEVLRNVHKSLNVDHESFDEIVLILRQTLAEFKIEADDIETVVDAIEERRFVIVSEEKTAT